MFIEDGSSGKRAKVNKENMLETWAVATDADHHANAYHGDAYSVLFQMAATANGDCIFYMSNDSDTKDISIGGLTLYTSADEELWFQINDKGTRNSATALTPSNLNGGSGKDADATCEQGADLDGGSATLTGGRKFEHLNILAARSSADFPFEEDVVLKSNNTLSVWSGNNQCNTWGTLHLYHHEPLTEE